MSSSGFTLTFKGGAGKTNTVRSLLGLGFVSTWDSTIGVGLTEVSTNFASEWKRVRKEDFATRFVNRLAVEQEKLMQEGPKVTDQTSEHKDSGPSKLLGAQVGAVVSFLVFVVKICFPACLL